MNSVKEVVNEFKAVVYSDSHIVVNISQLQKAVEKDYEEIGALPTREEIYEMVCGEYESEVVQNLNSKFSNINAYLQQEYALGVKNVCTRQNKRVRSSKCKSKSDHGRIVDKVQRAEH